MLRQQDRLRGCIEKHEFQRRLGEHEAHLAGWLMLHGEMLPPDADLPALLGSEEVSGRGAAWNGILLTAHESEPLKNA